MYLKMLKFSPMLNEYRKETVIEFINYALKIGKVNQGNKHYTPTLYETHSFMKLMQKPKNMEMKNEILRIINMDSFSQ